MLEYKLISDDLWSVQNIKQAQHAYSIVFNIFNNFLIQKPCYFYSDYYSTSKFAFEELCILKVTSMRKLET